MNTLYVLITIANASYGVSISQQDYLSKEKCEVAAIVVDQAAKEIYAHRVVTRCVPK